MVVHRNTNSAAVNDVLCLAIELRVPQLQSDLDKGSGLLLHIQQLLKLWERKSHRLLRHNSLSCFHRRNRQRDMGTVAGCNVHKGNTGII